MQEIADPTYEKLTCTKCGNSTDFVEFARTQTKQPFTVKNGEVDWLLTEILDEVNEPEEIQCQSCGEVVWRAKLD